MNTVMTYRGHTCPVLLTFDLDAGRYEAWTATAAEASVEVAIGPAGAVHSIAYAPIGEIEAVATVSPMLAVASLAEKFRTYIDTRYPPHTQEDPHARER